MRVSPAPERVAVLVPAVETAPSCPREGELMARARELGELCARVEGQVAELTMLKARLAADECGLKVRRGDSLADLYSTVVDRISERTLAALLVRQAAVADRIGLALELDPRSRLRRLPPSVDSATAVSIVGNLIQNAFDAVADGPRGSRRVRLTLSDAEGGLRVRVRDWGPGLESVSDQQVLRSGFTTKAGHSGVGVPLVRDLAAQAGGRLVIERLRHGTAFEVEIPGWRIGAS
ncbi:MAG: ATP-binding protein [Microvirga sp.]